MNRPETSGQLPIVRLPQQLTLLLSAALLLGLAFPRPNLWLLAYVALVPLTLVGVRGRPLGRTVGLTYGVFVIWWLVMIGWMAPVTLPGYMALSAYMALYPLAYILVMRLIHQRFPTMPFTFTVPLVWVALEYVRGLVMTGFPWFLLGHSQPTWVIQIADVVGAYGVSFFVGMANGLVADVLTRPLVRPVVRRTEGGRRIARAGGWGGPMRGPLFTWSMVLAMALTYGYYRTAQTDQIERDAPALRVAVVQTDVPQDNKAHPTDEQDIANFREMILLSRQAMGHDPPPDLIVWPETMVPRAINDEAMEVWQSYGAFYDQYRQLIEEFVVAHDVTLVVGAHAMTNWQQVDGMPHRTPLDRFNSAYFFKPGGGLADRYDKLHRVPYGEYMPWVERWPFLQRLVLRLTPHDHDYSLRAGDAYTRFEMRRDEQLWRLAAPICFEDVVSYVTRHMSWEDGRKTADLLVNLTNDGWFAGTAEAPQHEQIARFRSVENRVPMARAVNRGVSGFIDSAGRIRGRVVVDGETQEVAGYAVADLRRDHRTTIFQRVGDLFAALCLALAVMLGLVAGSGRFLRGTKMGMWMRTQVKSATGKVGVMTLAAALLLGSGAGAAAGDEATPQLDAGIAAPPDQLVGPQPLRLDADGRPQREPRRDAGEPKPLADPADLLRTPGDIRLTDPHGDAAHTLAPELDEQPLPRKPLEELRELDQHGLERFAVSLLVQASLSDQAALRSNAIEAFQERPERAMPVVHRGLRDGNPGVRFAAAVTAGMLELEDLRPAVRPLLEDDHPAVRAAALSTLHVLGARVNLTPLADMLESQDPALRGNVAMLLGLMGNKTAVPMLKRAAIKPMPRATAAEVAVARIQIGEAIARLDDDSGLNALRGGAYSQFDEVRAVAIMAMGAVGDRRMEVGLESMLQQPPMEIQLAAAGSLARLGNERGREITEQLAGHEASVIRAQAAWVLGWFEGAETLDLLRRLLADEVEMVRVSAAASLLRRLPPAPPAQQSPGENP